MKYETKKVTVRIPQHIASIIDEYTNKTGVSLNSFFINIACKEIANDSNNQLSELDRSIIKERHSEAEIKKLEYLRSKNLSEAWAIGRIIKELKKMFMRGDYIDEIRAEKNLDYSLEMILKGGQPKKDLMQLLPGMVFLQKSYGWKYGVLKTKMALKKLGISDLKIEEIASSQIDKESLKYKRKRFERNARSNNHKEA